MSALGVDLGMTISSIARADEDRHVTLFIAQQLAAGGPGGMGRAR